MSEQQHNLLYLHELPNQVSNVNRQQLNQLYRQHGQYAARNGDFTLRHAYPNRTNVKMNKYQPLLGNNLKHNYLRGQNSMYNKPRPNRYVNQNGDRNTSASVEKFNPEASQQKSPIGAVKARSIKFREKKDEKLSDSSDGHNENIITPNNVENIDENTTINGNETHNSNTTLPSNHCQTTETTTLPFNEPEYLEAEVERFTDFLSQVEKPKIAQVTPRSARFECFSPDINKMKEYFEVSENEFLYEVFLAEYHSPDVEGSFKMIYNGPSLTINTEALRPASKYAVKYLIAIDEIRGHFSEITTFTTPADVPTKPLAPKLQDKKKNFHLLKWFSANDNGAKVKQYVLEYDEGQSAEDNFVKIYSGRDKTYKVTKLQPKTLYRYRIYAENEIGKSEFSDVVGYYTSGTVPAKLEPPKVTFIGAHELRFEWTRLENATLYALQMRDSDSEQPFMSVYAGEDNRYYVNNLKRRTKYEIRLKAENEEGSGEWSNVILQTTGAEIPAPPSKPRLKGKCHSRNFKVCWSPPEDDGGSPVNEYTLECNTSDKFHVMYEGKDTEATCTGLEPGVSYPVRVKCRNEIGESAYSYMAIFTTNPVPPEVVPSVKVVKVKQDSLVLKWVSPACDGGATVALYDAESAYTGDEEEKLESYEYMPIYNGAALEVTVNDLLPGSFYLFRVRALNSAGDGPWCDPIRVQTAPGVPQPGEIIEMSKKSPNNVIVKWQSGKSNGGSVTAFRLHMQEGDEEQVQIYSGPNTHYELKNLKPVTRYTFCISSQNCAGWSELSESKTCLSLPTTPSEVSSAQIESVISATAISVSFLPPCSNGSEITRYSAECSSSKSNNSIFKTVDGASRQILLDSLRPDTVYKIRIRAENEVGCGAYSNAIRLRTHPVRPEAPVIEIISATHSGIKVRWNDLEENSDFNTTAIDEYLLEMTAPEKSECFNCIYRGNLTTFKVTKLKELTLYAFRVKAVNAAGDGDYSEVVTARTEEAPPPQVKGLKISDISSTSCNLQWDTVHLKSKEPASPKIGFFSQPSDTLSNASTSADDGNMAGNSETASVSSCMLEDNISYLVQVSPDARIYDTVYTGSKNNYRVTGLNQNVTYSVRVATKYIGVHTGKELTSSYCQPMQFTTRSGASNTVSASNSRGNKQDGGRKRNIAKSSTGSRSSEEQSKRVALKKPVGKTRKQKLLTAEQQAVAVTIAVLIFVCVIAFLATKW